MPESLSAATVGVIAIGRNEGERLRACLSSALAISARVVYVDSGSTDGSACLAAALGASAIDLDPSIPFSAARARNEGFAKLLGLYPETEFVFFTDGDCEIVPSFVSQALETINSEPRIAVVCGRRRERHPGASIYNTLCDIEWNTPIGDAKSCGGDSLMRVSAFKAAGGFNPAVIAGEEPELCVRLRQAGNRIVRIDAEMTVHDAAITRFGQWWKRNIRTGYAYAEGKAMHGSPPERHCVKQVRSNDLFGLVVPVISILLAGLTHGVGIGLWIIGYGMLYLKTFRQVKQSLGTRRAVSYTWWIAIGKIPQAWGQMRFRISRWLAMRSRIIEYKTAAARTR